MLSRLPISLLVVPFTLLLSTGCTPPSASDDGDAGDAQAPPTPGDGTTGGDSGATSAARDGSAARNGDDDAAPSDVGPASDAGPAGDAGAADAPPDAAGLTCSADVACGELGATYAKCVTTAADGTCARTEYRVSDGTTYTCASCVDCTAAEQSLGSDCANRLPPQTGCATATACGSGGITYRRCETDQSQSCQSVRYDTTDGHSFACASCGDCADATAQLEAYCASLQTPTTDCTEHACGAGVTYQQCTTTRGAACESMYYTTSDGFTYLCDSCTDCASASSNVQNHCSNLSAPKTSCTGKVACGARNLSYQFCTVLIGSVCQSRYYLFSDGNRFDCNDCTGDCSYPGNHAENYCQYSGGCLGGPACGSADDLCCLCAGGVVSCQPSNQSSAICSTYSCSG